MPDREPARYLGIGDALPEITLPRLDGGAVSLSTFRGQFALLFLWASW